MANSFIGRRMPRIQEVVLPVLRDRLGANAQVVSWVPKIADRQYPIVNVRRLGGLARTDLDLLDHAVIELTVYHDKGLVEAEDLYLDCRQILWEMVRNQTLTTAGYLHSFRETFGPTQFDSPFDDTFRIQGLIQLGLRPTRIPKE